MQSQQNPKYQACKSLKELLLHNTAREKSPSVTVTSLEYVLSNCSVAPAHEALGRIPTQKENRLEHISCRVMVTLPAENQTDSTLFNVSEKCPSEFKTNPQMYLSSFCLHRATFRLAVLKLLLTAPCKDRVSLFPPVVLSRGNPNLWGGLWVRYISIQSQK